MRSLSLRNNHLAVGLSCDGPIVRDPVFTKSALCPLFEPDLKSGNSPLALKSGDDAPLLL
jgi:hypothetical protein